MMIIDIVRQPAIPADELDRRHLQNLVRLGLPVGAFVASNLDRRAFRMKVFRELIAEGAKAFDEQERNR